MSANKTDSQRQTQRYYLEIQRSVAAKVPDLIRNARQLVDGIASSLKITSTQVSNLNNVSAEAVTVEEVVGFIQYQIGREKSGNQSWGEAGFGDKLIKELTALQPQAQGIVNLAFKKFAPEGLSDKQEQERVWLLLAQQYTGHLRRYVTYKRPEKGDRDER